MADQAAIDKILKALARGTSDNAAEADISIRFAYTRMQKEEVRFEDLLKQPDDKLYQASLMRLAEHFARMAPNLSENAKRDLYNELVRQVIERFTPRSQKSRAGESDQDQTDPEREEHARRYRESSRRQEEARRAQSEPPKPPPGGRPGPGTEKPYERQNIKTPTAGGGWSFQYDPDRYPLEFPIRNFFMFFFGPNSYIGSVYSYPRFAFNLLMQSCLVGGLTFGALLIVLAFLIKKTDFAPVMLIGYVFFYHLGLTLFTIVFVTSYIFYERGWYPRGPRVGETDIVSMTTSTWRLVLAIAWRFWGAGLWIGRRAYTFGQKLRQ